jgi:hypothetical protein
LIERACAGCQMVSAPAFRDPRTCSGSCQSHRSDLRDRTTKTPNLVKPANLPHSFASRPVPFSSVSNRQFAGGRRRRDSAAGIDGGSEAPEECPALYLVQTMDATARHLGPCQIIPTQPSGRLCKSATVPMTVQPYPFHRSPMIFCR